MSENGPGRAPGAALGHRPDMMPKTIDADPSWSGEIAAPSDDGAPAQNASERSGATLAAAPASAWLEAEARAATLVRRTTGAGLGDHLMAELGARSGARMLAIGAGASGVAIDVTVRVPGTALTCIDSKVEWLAPERQRARDLGLKAHFAALDLETVDLEPAAFDLVFCHATLHRVIELEALVNQIERTLRRGGVLVIIDVVTRNGYSMWPETREIVQAIWTTLPSRFRLNHTAYGTALIDDQIWEPDPPPGGVRTSRPEDIVRVVKSRFSTRHFVPYFSLSRRFFDSMYGPNYNLAVPLDKAVFDWIWALDVHYLATKRLRPETFFGVYRAA
jgi:SAM-dependent methyltransferase